jgi:arginyl-tRNA--protein-N-Asp/Glu arginylyltransferase
MVHENDTVYLSSVKMDVLDNFLAIGWFRMHETVFTTQYFEDFDGNWKVHWLRYKVKDVCSNRFKQFRKNEQFSVTIRPLTINQEVEDLYSLYALNVSHMCQFELMNVLGPMSEGVFDSHMIEVRNGRRLIAVGIFDKGKDAIAGITNFYDQSYNKYSLGKYLIYLKYRYCLEHDITYYYPGYFSLEMSKFDYKLFLDKNASEVFLPDENAWIPYDLFQLKMSS